MSTALSCPGWLSNNDNYAISIIYYLFIVPDGIAWDWINDKLYWTDLCKDTIEVYDPTTGLRRVLLYTDTSTQNKDIVVDPTTGQVYS